MAVLLVFSIVSLAVFCQNKPLTRFARSLIQGSRPPTATFEHFTGEGVKVTVALASAMMPPDPLCLFRSVAGQMKYCYNIQVF